MRMKKRRIILSIYNHCPTPQNETFCDSEDSFYDSKGCLSYTGHAIINNLSLFIWKWSFLCERCLKTIFFSLIISSHDELMCVSVFGYSWNSHHSFPQNHFNDLEMISTIFSCKTNTATGMHARSDPLIKY